MSRENAIQKEKLNDQSRVKKVIAVVSGKGGVGKSLVTSLMAVLTKRNGSSTAILDADITGPSIPKMFGVHDKAMGTEDGILPVESRTGVKMMSVNLLLPFCMLINDCRKCCWHSKRIKAGSESNIGVLIFSPAPSLCETSCYIIINQHKHPCFSQVDFLDPMIIYSGCLF